MVSQQGGGGGVDSSYANLVNLLSGKAPGTSSAPPPMLALLTNRPAAGIQGTNNSANAVEHDMFGNPPAAQHPALSAMPGQPAASNPYAALNPEQMAADQFAPQYALLDQLAAQSRNQYTTAGNNVGGMWDALAKATAGNEGKIKQNYAQAGSTIGKAYNDATAATNNAFSGSRNQIADIAQRLGVSAAVPSALKQGSDQQGLLDALIQNSGASYQGLNTVLGNSDVQYNRDNAHVDTQAGINARGDFASKLQAALQQLGGQRLTLQGQQSQAANGYQMSIAQQEQQAAEKAAALAQTEQYHQADMMLKAQQLKQAADQFNATHGANAANSNLSPSEYLAQEALKEYGNQQSATNARNAILDTINAGGPLQPHGAPVTHWANANDFVQSVLNRNPDSRNPNGGDYRQLQQLAMDYYMRLAGGANKPI